MRPLWNDLVNSRAFWLTLLKPGIDFNGCASLLADESILSEEPECGATVILAFPAGFSLRLDVLPWQHELRLSHRDYGRSETIGMMDSHQMSDLFRWEEFLAVTQHLAGWSGPGWANELLLSPYVAADEDCAGPYLALLRRCLVESRLFTEGEAEHVVAYAQRVRPAGFPMGSGSQFRLGGRRRGRLFDEAGWRGFQLRRVRRLSSLRRDPKLTAGSGRPGPRGWLSVQRGQPSANPARRVSRKP